MIMPLIKKNKLSVAIILLLGIGLLVSLVFCGRAGKEGAKAREEIEAIEKKIEGYNAPGANPPSQELIAHLKEKEKLIKEQYGQAKEAFNRPETRMPREIPDPLAFKERLAEAESRIYERAQLNNFPLAGSLGVFASRTAMPSPSDIPDLLKQLELTEALVNLAIEAGVSSLDGIAFTSPLNEEIAGLPGTPLCRKFPFELSLTLPSSRLGGFFYQVRLSPYFLTIESWQIGEGGGRGGRGDFGESSPARGERYQSAAIGENRINLTLAMSAAVFSAEGE